MVFFKAQHNNSSFNPLLKVSLFLESFKKSMVNPKRLIAMARKWQKFTINKRRRLSFPTKKEDLCSSSVAKEGHFAVYTIDKRRFEFPLEYLSSSIFVELFNMSEEEFGLPAEGPITLPCDSMFLEYVIRLVHGHVSEDVQKALLACISACHLSASSSYYLQRNHHHQVVIFGF